MKTNAYKLMALSILLICSTANLKSQSLLFSKTKANGIHTKSCSSLNLTTAGTVETWFYMNSYNNFGGLIHKGDRKDFSDETYTLQLWNNNKVYFALVNPSTEVVLQSSQDIVTGRWYHVAVCWNSSGINMYINGQLDNSTTSSITLSYSNLSDTTRNGLNIGMQLNEDYDATYKKVTFDGYMDEVRVWNIRLAQYQVQKRMFTELNSADSLWSNLVAYYKLNENAGKVIYDTKVTCNPGWFVPGTSDRPEWSSSVFPKSLTWAGSTNDDFEVTDNWSQKIKPHKFAKTIVPSGVTNIPNVKTSSTVEVYDLEVQSGGVLKVNSNKQLKVNGNMVIKSGSGKTGNAYVDGTLQVTGTVTFERDVTSNGWHYISSPIANTNTNSFMGAALYQYNEATATWTQLGANTTLTPLRGYDI